MATAPESPAKGPPVPSRAIPILSLLVNIVTAGLLVGVLVLLARINTTLKDEVPVRLPQSLSSNALKVKVVNSDALQVRLANLNAVEVKMVDAGGDMVGSYSKPLYVSPGLD